MIRILLFCAAGGFVLVCLGCGGNFVALDFVGNLLGGWALFLKRVVPALSVNWAGVATAAVCLGFLAGGLQFFLRWYARQVPSPETKEAAPAPSWSARWTAMILAGVLLLFTAGISAVGVVHQTAWLMTSPEPLVDNYHFGARMHAQHNVRKVGLALHKYHDENRTFPPGGTFDARGRMHHGWQTLILPYISEREDLYRRIRLDVPWNHVGNVPAFQTIVPEYLHYMIDRKTDDTGLALSSLAGNVRVLGGDSPWSMEMITDGTANTLLAGEVVQNLKPWGHPANWRDPAKGINRSPDGFGSPLSRGAHFLFADGSVRFLDRNVDVGVLKALSTPTGGEDVSDF